MLVCVQVVNTGLAVASLPDALAMIDFINGSYELDGVAFTASQVVDQPALITANGLEVGLAAPFQEVEILAPFRDYLLDGDFTIVMEVTLLPAPNNNAVRVLRVQNADQSEHVGIDIIGAGLQSEFSCFCQGDGSGTTVDTGPNFDPGIHTLAMTNNATHLAFSADGEAVVSDTFTSSTFTMTRAFFGGWQGEGTFDGFYVRKVSIYDNTKSDTDLPGLTP